MHSTEISLLTEPEIADFLEAATRERGEAEWPRLAQFAQDMLKHERSIWTARQGTDYVGMISLRWQSDYTGFRRTPPAPEIIDLYVWQACRRHGIASLLLQHIEHVLREKHYQRVGLGIGVQSEDQPAKELYIKHHYRFDGSGPWWQGKNIAETDKTDPAIAPVLLMMDKML
ncbi:MAG TPA: GNAT family N-acetyltransferase [Alphaproteobacteria bacterium]